jgi:hypothetical protein
MNDLLLLNPNGQLIPEIATRMFETRKSKPIWAKRIETKREVETLEGRVIADSGDYLCRGIVGEYWPQNQSKLFEKYISSEDVDSEGWRRFDPKREAAPVEATQLMIAFRVTAQWGELTGKPNDYVVRSKTDPADIWIVDKTIFEASYELRPHSKGQPTLDPEIWKRVVAEEKAKDEALRKANAGKAIVISQVEAFELRDLFEEKRSDGIEGSAE